MADGQLSVPLPPLPDQGVVLGRAASVEFVTLEGEVIERLPGFHPVLRLDGPRAGDRPEQRLYYEPGWSTSCTDLRSDPCAGFHDVSYACSRTTCFGRLSSRRPT